MYGNKGQILRIIFVFGSLKYFHPNKSYRGGGITFYSIWYNLVYGNYETSKLSKMHLGLSRRKCPVFQKTKLRILIIIWIVIEIWALNFMFLTRKLAGNVKYIVFGAIFITVREKKINVPKGGRFCRICEHKD